ncbi:MAG: hypothetical protein D6771_04235 [Zetaproteobacteria bacterium]|nr:MAG: hypothetical protein D6771_04235 [Zetaproteobacteria bacterium]
MIEIRCPSCGVRFRVPKERALRARRFHCRLCGAYFARKEPSQPELAPVVDPLPTPPVRRTSLAPWLAVAALIVAAAGFYAQRDAWLAEPHLRGWLLAAGWSLPRFDGDWQIVPSSLAVHRLVRNDGSEVMTVEGAVRNLLRHAAPPPALQLKLWSDERASPLATWIMPITEPPTLDALLHAPWRAPPPDTVPVPGGGYRSFLLVVEAPPPEATQISLRVVNRR